MSGKRWGGQAGQVLRAGIAPPVAFGLSLHQQWKRGKRSHPHLHTGCVLFFFVQIIRTKEMSKLSISTQKREYSAVQKWPFFQTLAPLTNISTNQGDWQTPTTTVDDKLVICVSLHWALFDNRDANYEKQRSSQLMAKYRRSVSSQMSR